MLSLLLAVTFLSSPARPTPPVGCTPTRWILTYGDSKTKWIVGSVSSNNEVIWQQDLLLRGRCSATFNYSSTYATATYPLNFAAIATNGITVAGRQDIVDADLAGIPETRISDILFGLGSNDAFFGDAAAGNEAAWKADLAYIWDAMHTKWPNAQIYYSETWRQGYDDESDTLATWYAAVASGRSYVHLCDNERSWVKGADDGATMFWDGIHFSRAGAAEKARLAAACLGY